MIWQFLTGLVLSVGLLLLVVPGLMWYSSYSLAGPDLVVEQNGLGRALNRGGRLYSGARAQVTVLIGTFVLLLAVPPLVVMLLGGEADTWMDPVWVIVLFVLQSLAYVPLTIAPIVAYYSRRCVVENLDLHELSTMVESIGERRPRVRRGRGRVSPR